MTYRGHLAGSVGVKGHGGHREAGWSREALGGHGGCREGYEGGAVEHE